MQERASASSRRYNSKLHQAGPREPEFVWTQLLEPPTPSQGIRASLLPRYAVRFWFLKTVILATASRWSGYLKQTNDIRQDLLSNPMCTTNISAYSDISITEIGQCTCHGLISIW